MFFENPITFSFSKYLDIHVNDTLLIDDMPYIIHLIGHLVPFLWRCLMVLVRLRIICYRFLFFLLRIFSSLWIWCNYFCRGQPFDRIKNIVRNDLGQYKCYTNILVKCHIVQIWKLKWKKNVNYLLLFCLFENLLFIILILLDNIFLCVESTNWLS